MTVQFAPRNLISRYPGRSGTYSQTIERLPIGTARVEVRARQDGLNAAPPAQPRT